MVLRILIDYCKLQLYLLTTTDIIVINDIIVSIVNYIPEITQVFCGKRVN